MTVREQLAAWGIDVERLLDVDLDADQFGAGRDPQAQAWCDGLELEVHVFPLAAKSCPDCGLQVVQGGCGMVWCREALREGADADG